MCSSLENPDKLKHINSLLNLFGNLLPNLFNRLDAHVHEDGNRYVFFVVALHCTILCVACADVSLQSFCVLV